MTPLEEAVLFLLERDIEKNSLDNDGWYQYKRNLIDLIKENVEPPIKIKDIK